MSTDSTNDDDGTVTIGTCRDNSGGPRDRPADTRTPPVAIVVSWRLAAGCAVARTNHDTVVISSSSKEKSRTYSAGSYPHTSTAPVSVANLGSELEGIHGCSMLSLSAARACMYQYHPSCRRLSCVFVVLEAFL